MTDTTTRALCVFTDLTLSPRETFVHFVRISRRWKPISRAFVLHCAGVCRKAKEMRVADEIALGTWCDDGGRA